MKILLHIILTLNESYIYKNEYDEVFQISRNNTTKFGNIIQNNVEKEIASSEEDSTSAEIDKVPD